MSFTEILDALLSLQHYNHPSIVLTVHAFFFIEFCVRCGKTLHHHENIPLNNFN